MIYLGLKDRQKEGKIVEYVKAYKIKHIIIFSGEMGGQITNKKLLICVNLKQ